ncbi:MAG: RNA 3'-terminal phosphate cyclase [Desulfurococcales archaeon]|nr:RNA 3'-terminal phosphate cyclase [Desulfurococcales archaeon]
MKTVDGSMGEGGGQILRTALAISSLYGIPLRVVNIRVKRAKPGLRPQHLTAVRALAEITGARVKGATVGSTEIVFEPGKIRGGDYRFDIGTAGSISLLIQALLPVLVFADENVSLKVTGGTDVPLAPPIDYVRFVMRENLKLMGISFNLVVHRRGHYPRGGGIISLSISPTRKIRPTHAVFRGDIVEIRGISHAVRLPFHVASRQALSARKVLEENLPGIPVSIDLEHYHKEVDPHLGPGSGIVLWARCGKTVLGADSLGRRGKPAEKVGEEAAAILIEDLRSGMAFDRYMSDMMPLYAALADGVSEIGGAKLTSHAETVFRLLNLLVGDRGFSYELRREKDGYIARIEGVPPRTSS